MQSQFKGKIQHALSALPLETDVTDVKLGASGLWLGMQAGDGHRHTTLKLFWPQPMVPWATGYCIEFTRIPNYVKGRVELL